MSSGAEGAVDPEDPLFDIEAFEGEETDSADADRHLYGW